jgi:hypothetical protein
MLEEKHQADAQFFSMNFGEKKPLKKRKVLEIRNKKSISFPIIF